MARRSRLAAIGLAAGSLVGTVVMRRRRRQHQTRVDLYFEDGSMLSMAEGTSEVDAIMPAAREVLAVLSA